MNQETLSGEWKMLKGAMKTKWGKLTEDDLTIIEGRREELVGKIQQRYGIAKDEAEKQLAEFKKNYEESRKREESRLSK